MNKKELIEKINAIPWDEGAVVDTLKINRAGLIKLIEQFDEPKEKEKITLPRPVANWISCVRGRNKTLHFALENAPEEVNLWFCEDEKNRQNIFADAWANGYHIEKEKRYIVKIKGLNSNYSVLKYQSLDNSWFMGSEQEYEFFKFKHTKEELEKAGFGEVFNSPLFEIEEVTE